jgi:hypothetical protein
MDQLPQGGPRWNSTELTMTMTITLTRDDGELTNEDYVEIKRRYVNHVTEEVIEIIRIHPNTDRASRLFPDQGNPTDYSNLNSIKLDLSLN